MKRSLTPILLAVSLAVNLFLGGVILGGRLGGGEEPGGAGPPPRTGRLASAMERLDPEEAAALRSLLRERSDAAEPRVAALRSARRELDAVMSEPRYDPEAARAALVRVRAEEAALRTEVDEALVQFAARLDAEERAALAPLLRKGRRVRGGDPVGPSRP